MDLSIMYDDTGNLLVLSLLIGRKSKILEVLDIAEEAFKISHQNHKEHFKSWLNIVYELSKKNIEETEKYLEKLVGW